jgi:thiamine-phosphate pyrophosphorylase
MAEPEQPQLYLITPPQISLSSFPDQLARVLDAAPVACLRLALATSDEDQLLRAGDALRELAHSRDVPLVIAQHTQLAERLGLDGVHLSDGARGVRAARKALGPDAIVGAFCASSRHDGMTAGGAGADYVAFGPVAETALGTGQSTPQDLFAWWSEMIEVPVVAEGALDAAGMAELAPVTDFFGIGPEIWGADDPAEALLTLTQALR